MSMQPTQSYESLMRGLRELDLRGPYVPNELVLTGFNAFPLLMNSRGQVQMAASLYGRGRIVVLGHEGYLKTFPDLVQNALLWLRGDGSNNPSVGVHKHIKGVADHINKSTFQVTIMEALKDNPKVGVYVTDAYSVGADVKDLVAFMKAGGGVLIGGQAWNWAAGHPKENTFQQFPGNKVSGVAGIYFSSIYVIAECLPVSPQMPFSWMALRVVKDFKDDLEVLLKGIPTLDMSGIFASEVMVHSPLAFPIGTTEDGRAFLAGAYYGLGRVIVTTHEAALKEKKLSSFWSNAIDWLDQGRKGVIAVKPKLKLHGKSGLKYVETEFRKDLSVFVCEMYNDNNAEEIQDFVAEGGGLLIGGQSWNWASSQFGKNPMTDFSGNKILNKMGLSVLPSTISGSRFKAPVPDQANGVPDHFYNLLHHFARRISHGEKFHPTEHEKERLQKLGKDCINFLSLKAYNSHFYTEVLSVLTDILKSSMPQVCENHPAKEPKDQLLLSLASAVYNASQDPDALLPSLIQNVPSMKTVENRTIRIDVNTAEETWISTGLYLPPGMKTNITIPTNIVNKRWTIQIGCHTDRLNAEELKRAPCVHERFPVTSEMMQVWNLWGGLIYLVAPPNTKVEGAEATVQMAVPAPYYKSGVTTEADWLSLRKASSPWAELEFDNIILTVPSDVVRDLDCMKEVAALWDDIMKGVADLAVIPCTFARKERIVADVQISAGWMHAGYPVMIYSSAASKLVTTDDARTKGLWGPIHELGHNQQRSCWEFPPNTTECTCNLWSVYVHEEMLGINRAQANPSMTLTNRKDCLDKYVKGGKKLDDWRVWVALETYMQLQEKFGWDAFKKVFAAYHQMSNFPNDNNGKMNLYAVTFSQTVGMNLAGFFKAWGWPIETATDEKLSNLPPWSDHPMVHSDPTSDCS